jgi:integrase
MKSWVFQDSRQKAKLGDKCPWSAGWYENGRKRSKRIGCRSLAEKYAAKLAVQLESGTFQSDVKKRWETFVFEWVEKIGNGLEPQTLRVTQDALRSFERLAKPGQVAKITTATIDGFIAKRRVERGRKVGSTISPASVNKELRHLKAVLRVAVEWGYLPKMPRVRMVKEPVKLIRYVTPGHFAGMYTACDVARHLVSDVYSPADWWRGLLTFLYLTGWRVNEPLSLRWEDVSFDRAEAILWHGDNKGKRDERVPLHPVVIEHLRKLVDFGAAVFPWPHNERTLYDEFARIQMAAKDENGERIINLHCREDHQHTNACRLYGFHDLRRAFATQNALRLTASALQALMRHKSYLTTRRYINQARQLDGAVEQIHVPDFLRKT